MFACDASFGISHRHGRRAVRSAVTGGQLRCPASRADDVGRIAACGVPCRSRASRGRPRGPSSLTPRRPNGWKVINEIRSAWPALLLANAERAERYPAIPAILVSAYDG